MDEPQPTGLSIKSPDRSSAHLKHPRGWQKFCVPVLIAVSASLAAGCLPLTRTPDRSIQATTSALAANPAEAVRTLEALPPVLVDRAVGISFETGDPATRLVTASSGSGIVWLETRDRLVIVTAGHVLPGQYDNVTVSQPQKRALGQGLLKTRTIEAARVRLITQKDGPLGLVVIEKRVMPDPEMNNLTGSNGNSPPLAGSLDWQNEALTTLGFPEAVVTASPWYATDCTGGSNIPVIDADGNSVFELTCNASPGASGEPLVTDAGRLAGFLQRSSKSGMIQAIPVAGEFFQRFLAPLLQQAGLPVQAGLNFSP